MKCPNCGSEVREWRFSLKSSLSDGLINLRSVQGVFSLGCSVCSETLKVVDEEVILKHLNGIKFIPGD